ncbi:MAG: NAD-dependent epimerase/dehydratase family protein [Actinomycetota bacterium]|nr:NAD-dependent epimerase/dehydratase family protein [Actinomycetota bacterium]
MPDDRIAVVGAAGFVGRNVVRNFADRGESVIAIVRSEDVIPGDFPAEVRPLDAGDTDALERSLGGVSRIVHLAARSGGIQLQEATHLDLYEDNRRLTDSVLGAAAVAGVGRVFLASSAVVYRDSASGTIDENDPIVGPGDAPTGYAWSKAADEVVAGWANDVETVVGRFGNVYGPEASFDPARSTVVHGLISRMVDAPKHGTVTVWGDGSAVRSFIFVQDVAAAIALILDRGEQGVAYNVDTSEAVTIRELASLIRDLAAPSVTLEFDSSKPSGAHRRVPDSGRLRSLGFTPTMALVDGLTSTIDWYRTHRAPPDRSR